ncbi:MAG: cytochrome C oxidase subunit IV family protein [Verrucomicrobiota bacterium]|jgi:cytochrome c oxidase subunit IV|nr:cytochrome C oxidase subunit IV family protein [Verrucomicrobiota bacterium]MDP7049715.1 cytochrome C oxidase subunit IV family protein [Verrucomicrobiota bacterium]
MSDSHDSPDFLQYLIRLFYMVGGVLVAGTLITVLIDVLFHMPLPMASFIGLSIALVKAGFVVAIFMHYKWDKKLIMITGTMVLTFIFFAGMMGLIMWTEGDVPRLDRAEVHVSWVVAAALLGLVLPASFTFLTIKLLSQPAPVEAAVPKAKRVAKKKKR